FSLRFAAIHHHSHDTCMTPRLCAEPKHLRLLKNGRPTKPGGTRTANSGGQNCAVVTRDMAGGMIAAHPFSKFLDRRLSVANRDPGRSSKNCGGSLYQEGRSEEHTSELQSRGHLVCRLLL